MSGREIVLEADALTAHAARVRALGADAADSVAEVRRARADGASLGVLCVFLSPVLGALAAAGSRGCAAAVRSLEADADLAISAAVRLLNADLGAEEGMRQLGRMLDHHDGARGAAR